jgi:nucleoside-diphosphate-sugar epimerase
MTRTYVITGAASGIGAKTYQILKEAGNKVIGVDIHNSDVNADLSTPSGRKFAAEQVIDLSDDVIDAVIACAGSASKIPKTISVNYFGVTEFLTSLLPQLGKSKAPRVVITSSITTVEPVSLELVEAMRADDETKAAAIAQSLVDQGGGVEKLIYSSSKRAISRWVRAESIKPDWAGMGIPLNAVGPGVVKTPMVTELIATPESRKALDARVPMPLHGYLETENVAALLIWLVSPENTHVTGQTIYIDGGSEAVIRGENIWDLAPHA